MKCELQKSKKSGKFIKFETNNDASWIKEDEEEDEDKDKDEEEDSLLTSKERFRMLTRSF